MNDGLGILLITMFPILWIIASLIISSIKNHLRR